jgi:hypothetical protein
MIHKKKNEKREEEREEGEKRAGKGSQAECGHRRVEG